MPRSTSPPIGRHRDYDAIVVGARPAGASTAMLLARAGRRVLLVDRAEYGDDALSTHALMRAGVLQLHRWGLLDEIRRAGTPPVRHTRFHYADEVVDIEMRQQDGVDALYARPGAPCSTGSSSTPPARPAWRPPSACGSSASSGPSTAG